MTQAGGNGEKRPAWYRWPPYYKGNPDSVIGPEDPIPYPYYTEKLDLEPEIGIVIGRAGSNLTIAEAGDYIAGYKTYVDAHHLGYDVSTDDDVTMPAYTGTSDLRKGPGHYPATPLPGQHGTVGIAGHRTTYGAPFHDIDKLKPGDRIELSMPYGRFTYRVERTRIVPPTATWVTDSVGYDRLILSACHPLYSAAQRIVVFAKLERTQPRGPASAG